MYVIADTPTEPQIVFPASLREAGELLGTSEGGLALAGGTAVQMRRRRSGFGRALLVDLRRIPGLDGIEVTGDELIIGPLVTHRRMETDPVVARHAPLLPLVFAQIANARIRSSATVGGNLCDADHRLDPPGALGILGATVELASPRGRRTVAVTDLYPAFERTVLERDEVLAAIHIPRTRADRRSSFRKLKSLGRNDWPCVGVAATLTTSDTGIRELAIGVTAVSPVPIHLVLDVTGLGEVEVLEAVDAGVAAAADPRPDLRGSVRFKRQMARVTAADTVRSVLAGGHDA